MFMLFVLITSIVVLFTYKLTETNSKKLILKTFNNTNEITIEEGNVAIHLSEKSDIAMLRDLLKIQSWNRLVYFNKKSFPTIFIVLGEVQLGVYQDKDIIIVDYEGKVSHYKAKGEIKNALIKFINENQNSDLSVY